MPFCQQHVHNQQQQKDVPCKENPASFSGAVSGNPFLFLYQGSQTLHQPSPGSHKGQCPQDFSHIDHIGKNFVRHAYGVGGFNRQRPGQTVHNSSPAYRCQQIAHKSSPDAGTKAVIMIPKDVTV